MVFSKRKKLSFLLAAAFVSMGMGGKVMLNGNQYSHAEEPTAKVVNPLAKYEFNDSNNQGKDSMGNYDLEFKNAYKEGGEGDCLNQGTLIDGGGVSFNGEYCIGMKNDNNLFNYVTGFTLCTEIKTDSKDEWQHYMGIGNDNNYFALVGRGGTSGSNESKQLILNAHGVAGEYWDGVWISEATNWGNSLTEFQKIVITVQPGGALNVYVNGLQFIKEGKLPGTLPSDWKAGGSNGLFSIGGRCNGPADRTSKGSVRNVAIYDFAMDATAVAAYNTKGELTQKDINELTQITGATAKFEEDATKVTLNETMTTADMLTEINDAKAEIKLSDNTTKESPIIWKEVYKEDGKYYVKGTFSSSILGYANTYGNEVIYELSVAGIKSVSTPSFTGGEIAIEELKDSMTSAEMLQKINKAKVIVTLSDDSTKEVEVTFTKIVAEMGVYTAQGDVLINGEKVSTAQVVLNVIITNEGTRAELFPIAKWEFNDSNNPCLDTMGKYTLQPSAKEGGNTSDPRGVGSVENGVLRLDGDDCLTLPEFNDVSEKIGNGFTLNFQYKQDGDMADKLVAGAWSTPIGFGFNDWNATKFCHFTIAENSKTLRINAHQITKDDKGNENAFWGPSVLENGADRMHNVTLTVRPGEKFNVYVDGVMVYNEDCPSDWNLSHTNMQFAIGGDCVWGNGYDFFDGWIDNVSIYNFAMTLDQSNAYWEKGKVVVGDMKGDIIVSISDTPKFEGEITNSKLTDTLTATQVIKRMNAATVDAIFENQNKVVLPITWERLEKINGIYYVIGMVDASNIGYATTVIGQTEVKQQVEVELMDRNINIDKDIEHGTVTADKTGAKVGETVTFTVVPVEGYEIGSFTVNNQAITVNEDGTYSYVVKEDDSKLEVFATFVKKEKKDKKGCNSSISYHSILFLLSVMSFVAVVKMKKKENRVK